MTPSLILVRKYGINSLSRRYRSTGIYQLHIIVSVFAADFIHASGYHDMGLVYQGYIVTQFLHRLHIMGREYYCRPLFLQTEYLLTYHLRIHRVEARERFIQNEQRRLVDHCGYELYLLGHSL